MAPTTTFCPTLACPARGQTGQGNIGMHSRTERAVPRTLGIADTPRPGPGASAAVRFATRVEAHTAAPRLWQASGLATAPRFLPGVGLWCRLRH